MAGRDTPRALTGMRDLLPPESERFSRLVCSFADRAEGAGYHRVVTPVVESLEVFLRVGEGTDVVTKEMYTFTDRDGEVVALRPESTASIVRAFLQHHPLLPWKVWYFSQHFRHEKPQRGRFRQHHQVGAEVIGVADPDVDVELIVLAWDFIRSLGVEDLRLEINSIGDAAARSTYAGALRGFLKDHTADLAPEDSAKVDAHPLRVLDSKNPRTRAVLVDAPRLLDTLPAEAIARFDRVGDGLASAGVPVTVNPHLVRGLDYYSDTVFEIVGTGIDAAQSTLAAGGRYDRLVEDMGGAPTPAVGFGAGVERILLACDTAGSLPAEGSSVDCFVVAFGGDGSDARDLCTHLRRAGISTDRSFDARSPKAQMRQADRSGARYALILGDDERAAAQVSVRDLRGESGQRAVDRDRLIDELGTLLS